ncbi:MAG: recombinase family protein [Gammaproteobacteria bacterium]|nr:recombinase family protein [Gammaproteobacteria bacterium]
MTHMIGYARVSTQEQNLQSQLDQLEKAGCYKIFKDQASGKTTRDRTELGKLLEYVREGDVVIVTQLDRLSRSLIDLLHLADQLGQQGVELLSLNESFDTTTCNGRLSFKIMGMLAEFERERIRERTIEGLKSARAQGRVGGRPRSLTEEQEASIYRMRKQGDSMRQIARTFEVFVGTIGRALKRHELSNAED